MGDGQRDDEVEGKKRWAPLHDRCTHQPISPGLPPRNGVLDSATWGRKKKKKKLNHAPVFNRRVKLKCHSIKKVLTILKRRHIPPLKKTKQKQQPSVREFQTLDTEICPFKQKV